MLVVLGLIVLAALPLDKGNKIFLLGDLSTNVPLWGTNIEGLPALVQVDGIFKLYILPRRYDNDDNVCYICS